MKYVVRIKAVSECMRIRRAALCHVRAENHTYDIHKEAHPLKKFISITIKDSMIIVDGKMEALKIGEEVFFYKKNLVNTGLKMEEEILVLGAMLIPLDIEMKDHYIDLIEKGETFDQWNGEIEYLLGMMYELDLKDDSLANEWYIKAKDKKFNFSLLNMDKVC
jgi:hypothetical protein